MIFIKRLRIKCFAIDTLDRYLYHVIIYNSKKEIVLDKITTYGEVFFDIPEYGVYHIIVIPLANFIYNNIYQTVFIHKNFGSILSFPFSKKKSLKKVVTLNLKDANYKGLPIRKGEVILWQNHM